ncbi:MAG: prephenate dehydrogenase [halophilic archaeon J07HX5]|nr:MAG: prephenate dehydrogenase [halophilic archaeon J07HX5]
MEALVVGGGTMGRWAGQVLRSTNRIEAVAVTDADPDVAADAAATIDGRVADKTEQFGVVCIAVPMPAVRSAVATHAPRATTAVFDLIGAMAPPIAAMRDHAPDCERFSLHPLFAPAGEPGNVPVVVDAVGPVARALQKTLRARGNHVFKTTAADHDQAMETVQARTHAALLAFVLAAEPVAEQFHTPVSAQFHALAEQLLDGTPRVYADIQATFDGAADVAAVADTIATADRETVHRLYKRARAQTQAQSRAEGTQPAGTTLNTAADDSDTNTEQ